MLRRKGSCQPQYVFKFHYLMCTCVSTWNMHVEVREQFSGIVSLLPSCVSWGTKLRSWGLVQAPLLTEPPRCPAPNLLYCCWDSSLWWRWNTIYVRCNLLIWELESNRALDPRAWPGSFSTRVIFVREQKAEGNGLTGAESWAGLLEWGSIPQGQLTPHQWWAIWRVFTGPVMELLSNMEVTTWSQVRFRHPFSVRQ